MVWRPGLKARSPARGLELLTLSIAVRVTRGELCEEDEGEDSPAGSLLCSLGDCEGLACRPKRGEAVGEDGKLFNESCGLFTELLTAEFRGVETTNVASPSPALGGDL